jgi:hypothetical protein
LLAVSALLPGLHLQASQKKSQPIGLDPLNPHYFTYQGETIVLISSGEHYGAVLNADFDFLRYLSTLESEGLNYTRLFGGAYVEVPTKSFGILRNDLAPQPGRLIAPWARSSVAGYAGGGNKFDLSQWNPEYFDRLRSFLSEAEKRGIVVEITLFSSHYGEAQWAISPFNRANNINQTAAIDWQKANTLENGSTLAWQEKYARKLVHEAGAFPNVIFEIQNEPWSDRPVLSGVVNPYLLPPSRDQFPNNIDLPDPLALAFEARVAEWIQSEEASSPRKHLIAQNYCDFGLPVSELIPGISIVNFHYAYPEAAAANYGLGKAIAYDETGFLGQSDASYLRQAWNFMLSGGSTFGALDYSFTVGHEDGTDIASNGPGGGSPTLRKQLGFLVRFLRNLPLAELAPDVHTVRHAGGTYARVLSGANLYAIYLDGVGPDGRIEVTLELPPGRYFEEWVDPTSGATVQIENFDHAGGEKKLLTPKFQNGMALHLNKSKNSR